MTGDDLRNARKELGRLWGLDRPIFAAELGRALRLSPSDPGQSIRDYETAREEPVPGPVAVAVEFMLKGFLPGGSIEGIVIKREPPPNMVTIHLADGCVRRFKGRVAA